MFFELQVQMFTLNQVPMLERHPRNRKKEYYLRSQVGAGAGSWAIALAGGAGGEAAGTAGAVAGALATEAGAAATGAVVGAAAGGGGTGASPLNLQSVLNQV